jgi:hypothetical protein
MFINSTTTSFLSHPRTFTCTKTTTGKNSSPLAIHWQFSGKRFPLVRRQRTWFIYFYRFFITAGV